MENNQSQPRVIVDPARQVSGPSIGLLVTGIIGGLFSVLGLIAAIVGISVGSIAGLTSDWADDVPQIYSDIYEGGAAIGFMFIGILVAAFIIYASLKMKDLEQWGLGVAASILAIIPCISPCCIIGLPIGIWSLVVLTRPDVRDAFK